MSEKQVHVDNHVPYLFTQVLPQAQIALRLAVTDNIHISGTNLG